MPYLNGTQVGSAEGWAFPIALYSRRLRLQSMGRGIASYLFPTAGKAEPFRTSDGIAVTDGSRNGIVLVRSLTSGPVRQRRITRKARERRRPRSQ
ncbi:MAG: hypothetical protein M3R67_03000 [Acidobacteriota bacterium]|nr:hypothetical protein [Acidobacteriota bacterium]